MNIWIFKKERSIIHTRNDFMKQIIANVTIGIKDLVVNLQVIKTDVW